MISDSIYKVNIDIEEYANEIAPENDVNFYTNLAERLIGRYADQIYRGLAKEMLSSEDAISDIAYSIILGDMKWKTDGGMKLSSWRIEQAKLGMQKYVNRKSRKQNMPAYHSMEPLLATSGQPPTYIHEYENREFAQVTLQKIIEGSGLTKKEAEAARMRSEGYTFAEIGKILHCSDENARLLNNKAIGKMSEYAAAKEITWT
jgi:RNA polymerase sigma factor (sigma-70 family)